MNFLSKILKKKEKREEKKETGEVLQRKAIKQEEKVFHPKGKIIAGILRVPHVTEKSSALAGQNKYVFSVNSDANKPQIQHAIEARYGVRVRDVHVLAARQKERRRGNQIGWKKAFKKAVVTLKEGQSIELT